METRSKLVKLNKRDKLVYQEMHQSAIGQLFYLSTRARPDIAYAVGNSAGFSSKPSQQQLAVADCKFLIILLNYEEFERDSGLWSCV